MKKLYCLAAGLLLAGATLKAQTTALAPPQAPCSTFEAPNPAGNWIPTACYAYYTDTNPLDGSQCVTLYDDSGGSWYANSVDYNNLGQLYLNQCLCFDYYLKDDGDASGSVPFNPTIYLTDGINTIAFVASTTVYEGGGWIHVCAPIQHCTGATLPGNADGNWTMSAGMSCTDFNNVLDNVTSVSFPTDINSCPCEIMMIDNVCVRACNNCQSDFKLQTTINTAGGGTATGDVFLNSTDPSATYQVSWGDGAVTTPYVSHIYAAPGTYNVCVSEYIKGVLICRTCVPFCFGKVTQSQGGRDGAAEGGNPASRANLSSGSTGIRTINDTKFDSEGFTIYPNPSKDYADVQISISKQDKVSIRIIDLFGKTVSEASGTYDRGSRSIRMNTERLATGIYTVEITVGGKVTTQKLSVSK